MTHAIRTVTFVGFLVSGQVTTLQGRAILMHASPKTNQEGRAKANSPTW
jgi:hypothetical protein